MIRLLVLVVHLCVASSLVTRTNFKILSRTQLSLTGPSSSLGPSSTQLYLTTRPYGSLRSSTQLHLFGSMFKNLGKQPRDMDVDGISTTVVAKGGKGKANNGYKLEKISNTQKRNWKEEEADRLKNQPNEETKDKQTESYNYKKANEFPQLYGGWIRKEGDQIAKQYISAVRAAVGKVRYMEVLFDPVPNLDEVAFGTLNNKMLRADVVKDLNVPDYVTNRGGPGTLEWSNLYWMNRLAQGLGAGKKILALSISGEGCKAKKGGKLPTLAKGVTLLSLTDAKKAQQQGVLGKADFVIMLSPCSKVHYETCIALGNATGAKACIALNAPYSATYDVGGGKPFELVYVMKRIPKGWMYRAYPKPFECIIEGPNYEVFKTKQFAQKPPLTEISKVSMAASAAKYGATGNDRIFQNRL